MRRANAAGKYFRLGLRRRALGTIGLTAVERVLAVAAAVTMARLMGPAEFGLYSTGVALVTLLGIPTALGLPTLSVRLIATYSANKQWALMRGLLRRSRQLVATLAVGVAAMAGGSMLVLVFGLGVEVSQVFAIGLSLLPILGLLAIEGASLAGLHHVVPSRIGPSLVLPLVFLVMILLWPLFIDGTMSADYAMWSRVLGAAFALALTHVLLARRLPQGVKDAVPAFDTRGWLASAVPLLALGGLTLVNNRVDLLMLGLMEGAHAAGLYQAAVRGAELVVFALVVVNTIVQPSIARLHTLGERGSLQAIVTKSARLATGGALPVAVVLAGFGRPLIRLVFGAEYSSAATPLTVLAVAQICNAAMGPVGMILTMTGRERDAAMGMAVGAAVNVVLNATLIPVWGVVGASIATGTSLIVWNLVQGNRVRRVLGLYPSVLGTPLARRGELRP